jgi:L-histidine N-alpha-methyltransferase
VTAAPGGGSSRAVAADRLVTHLGREDLDGQLCNDAREGLTSERKRLPSKWFYDERGSQLFDEITRLPEYYLTRAERQILLERSAEIAAETRADTIVELGCGMSEKTRILLDAFRDAGCLRRFVPFDVDPDTLEVAATRLVEVYPDLEVCGIVGDFERHLDTIGQPSRTMVTFLGSTIGNLDALQRAALLDQLTSSLKPGDFFLVGVDLVKDDRVIEAAYNDSAGVTSDFNLNVLGVLNRRLDGNFDLSRFAHVAEYNEAEERMEMWLCSTCNQRVRLDAIDLEITFADGELLHTEISCKFRREGLEQELDEAGLVTTGWWTDPGENFALSLSCKP